MSNSDKDMNFWKEDFIFMKNLYLYKYLDIELIKNYIYSDICEKSIKQKLKFLEKENYINCFKTGRKTRNNISNIYSLALNGYYSIVEDINSKYIDKDRIKIITQNWQHDVTIANILFLFKKSFQEKTNKDIRIFSQKQAYHFYGKEENNFRFVLRPNGAYSTQTLCTFIEYENEDTSFTYEDKLNRYQQYYQNELIVEHPNIKNHKNFNLLFIFKNEKNMISGIKKVKEIYSNGYSMPLYINDLNNMLIDPLDMNKYTKIY